MFLKQTHSPIGIDIGRSGVKLVQFRERGGRRSLLAAGRLNGTLPNNGNDAGERDAFVRGLKKLLASKRFGTRRAVLTLTTGDIDIRPLTLPFTDEDLHAKVRLEAASYLGCDVNDAIIEHVVLGEARGAGERRLEVLAASVEKAKVFAALDLLARAGLLVDVVDIAPLALCRFLRAATAEPDKAAAAIDIGTLTTQAVIMDKGQLRMARPINIGSQTLTEAVRTALEIGADEAEALKRRHGACLPEGAATEAPAPAENGESEETLKMRRIIHGILRDKLNFLTEELHKLLRYFSAQNQGRTAEKIYLVGGGAALKHLGELVSERIGIPVEVARPLSGLTGAEVSLRDDDEVGYAVACGLALRES